MAPTSYSYSCVPMDEFPKKLRGRKLPVWVGILLFLLVATLMTLQMEKAAGHRQQELVQKLQEEIKTLNQKLQEKSAELEKLRKENEALVFSKGPTNAKGPTNGNGPTNGKSPPNSGISLRLPMASVLLPLSLLAVLA